MLALVLGLIISAGLYFAYLWPSVEPVDPTGDSVPRPAPTGDSVPRPAGEAVGVPTPSLAAIEPAGDADPVGPDAPAAARPDTASPAP